MELEVAQVSLDFMENLREEDEEIKRLKDEILKKTKGK
jgi:hypothetical protein